MVIEDGQGNEQPVVCSHRATLMQRARWHQWKIGLDQLSRAGLNLRSISRMHIGVGNRTRPLAGGKGLIIIDDIALSSLGL